MLARPLGLAFVFVLCAAPAHADFQIVDLAAFDLQPVAVNDARQFAGTREFPGEGFRGFRWDAATFFTSVGTLGGASSSASAINGSGWVAGTSRVDPATTASHAYLWRPGTGLTDLGTLGGTNSSATALNAAGFVVGNSQTTGNSSTQAFLWRLDTNTMTPLGTLGGTNSSAIGVNVLGTVAGTSDVTGGTRPFIWTEAGGLVDLGGLGGTDALGRAFGINDLGQVVGRSERGDGTSGAFLWDPVTGFIDLGTFGGENSTAFGINNLGQVVGSAQDASGEERAFLWDAVNGLRDLNALVTNAGGFTLTGATSITDSGDVLAESASLDGTTVYLVTENPDLTPPPVDVPAPAGLVLAGIGIATGMWRRRLRVG
jgi:probable HAF family extracellular repeat protein